MTSICLFFIPFISFYLLRYDEINSLSCEANTQDKTCNLVNLGVPPPSFLAVLMRRVCGTPPTMLFRPLLSGGGVTARQAPPPWKPLAEEGSPPLVPTSLEGVASLLNGLSEQQYGVGVATMAYTAQRAKLAQGPDRQQWTQLFIDSFKYVYGDIMGNPDKALGLC